MSETFAERLNSLDPLDDDFVLQVDEIVEQTPESVMRDAYTDIFRFFESHPEDHCGMPGTLVHVMEDYYPNYVSALIESIGRLPSTNTVLMLNRILNSDLDANLRQQLLESLQDATQNKRCSTPIREEALGYLERHDPTAD